MGLAKYYPRLIKDFSLITKPERKLLKKGEEFFIEYRGLICLWQYEDSINFKLKKACFPFVTLLRFYSRYYWNRKIWSLYYANKGLNFAGKNWIATELKLGAVNTCKTFKFCKQGRKTKIYSDHLALHGAMVNLIMAT